MKSTITSSLLLGFAFALSATVTSKALADADTPPPRATPAVATQTAGTPGRQAPPGATVLEVGPDHNLWQIPETTNETGTVLPGGTVRSIGTGMNYWEPNAGTTGAWVPSISSF